MRRLMYVMVMLMAISLSGCGHKVEMSQIGIVAGLGIDQTENGYLMTAQVVNPSFQSRVKVRRYSMLIDH